MTGVFALLTAVGLDDGLPDRARIARAIADVLARPEFRAPEPTWWDRVKSWCGEQIGRVLRQLFGAMELDTTVGKVIVGILVLTLVAIVAHLVLTLISATKRASPPANSSRIQRLPTAGSVEDALALARELVAAGRFAEAMHALYRGALVTLDARGQARFDPSKTPGDYSREIAAADARRSFAALIEVFEPVAWGGRSGSASTWERMHACAIALGVVS